jgi:hypothetical protein
MEIKEHDLEIKISSELLLKGLLRDRRVPGKGARGE